MNKIPVYNFVIIGKSGAGKSSLINHLFNEEIAKVGQGKPVTGKEFEKFILREANLETNIYDSWGIEGGQTQEWLNYFNNFSNKCKSENISDWIHTAVYCISGESNRLEDFEKKVVDQLIKEELNPVVVITKSDLDLDDVFLKSVKNEYPNLSVVAICNVEKQIGLGSKKTISSKFGLKELKEEVQRSSLKSFEKRFLHIVEQITKSAKKNAIISLEKDVDEILKRSTTNLIGNISTEKLEVVEKEVVEKVNIYNSSVESKILRMYNEAVHIYGEFLLKGRSSLPIMESKQIRLIEDESFIEAFIKKIGPKKIGYTSAILPTLMLPTIILSTILIFGNSKVLLSLKGIDKESLKESIMRELVKYYSNDSIDKSHAF